MDRTLAIIVFACLAVHPARGQRFVPEVVDARVQIGYGVAVGDVDGDGKPDVVLVDRREVAWYRNPGWKRYRLSGRLTQRDHVCVAVRDVDGDGRVEVCVGGQWNPGETTDVAKSGSVHWLARPPDPLQPWAPVPLVHEPTVHRMRWVRARSGGFRLVVLPLHGRGNRGGQGAGVRVLSYRRPADGEKEWPTSLLDDTLHLTHNLDAVAWDEDPEEELVVASREGLVLLDPTADGWSRRVLVGPDHGGAGEVRLGRIGPRRFLAAVEPMHGSTVAVHLEAEDGTFRRRVLASDLAQGHALACADLLGLGRDQVVVGWRAKNPAGRTGIRLYVPDARGGDWRMRWMDEGGIACEDLRVADLDGDGRLDVVAAGRQSHDLKIYWNRP